MKKWTIYDPSSNTIIQDDFPKEYSQYKQVFNGGLDRTSIPASFFTKANVKDESFHKVKNFIVSTNTHFIQTSGYSPTSKEFICQTFGTYLGAEYLATTQTLENIKAGWVHIELSSMFFVSTETLNYLDDNMKEFFVRIVWNGETISHAGPFSKSLYSYRISTGTYSTSGTGTLNVYIRAAGPHTNDNMIDQTYHWWNMQGFMLARWR